MISAIFGVDISRDVDSVRGWNSGFPSTWCFSLTTTALTCTIISRWSYIAVHWFCSVCLRIKVATKASHIAGSLKVSHVNSLSTWMGRLGAVNPSPFVVVDLVLWPIVYMVWRTLNQFKHTPTMFFARYCLRSSNFNNTFIVLQDVLVTLSYWFSFNTICQCHQCQERMQFIT